MCIVACTAKLQLLVQEQCIMIIINLFVGPKKVHFKNTPTLIDTFLVFDNIFQYCRNQQNSFHLKKVSDFHYEK